MQLRDKAGDTQPVLPVALAAAQGTGGGTDPWLVVGVALIAATAALLGAIIAARTAATRQKEQLAHEERRHTKALVAERERLDMQLAAENERHRETLALEKETRELEELRKVMDAATETLNAANAKVVNALYSWEGLSPDAGPDERSAVGTLRDEARHSVVAANMLWYRVTLRLGDEHPVAQALDHVVTTMMDVGMLIDSSAPPSDDQQMRVKELHAARFTGLREFRNTAVKVIGSRL